MIILLRRDYSIWLDLIRPDPTGRLSWVESGRALYDHAFKRIWQPTRINKLCFIQFSVQSYPKVWQCSSRQLPITLIPYLVILKGKLVQAFVHCRLKFCNPPVLTEAAGIGRSVQYKPHTGVHLVRGSTSCNSAQRGFHTSVLSHLQGFKIALLLSAWVLMALLLHTSYLVWPHRRTIHPVGPRGLAD